MIRLDRRRFLQASLTATAIGAADPLRGEPARPRDPLEDRPAPAALVDTNVYLSRWPFRRLRGDETVDLVEILRSHGVAQAWAGSFDGLFHKDVRAVNEHLAQQCRQSGNGLLVPFGTVNPKLPDWKEDLRRCREEHGMPGIRLHPNYHRYRLDEPEFTELLQLAAEHRLIVQLAGWMEDERHQNPLMPVPEVDLSPLPDQLEQLPQVKLVLLNGFRAVRGKPLLRLFEQRRAWYDVALMDVIDPLAEVLAAAPLERVVFGSYAPMFYFDAALLKLRESELTDAQREAIGRANAEQLLQEQS